MPYDQVLSKLIDIDVRLARLEGRLSSECQAHQHQIDAVQSQVSDLKRRPGNGSNGNGFRSLTSWADVRLWGSILALLVSILTAIRTLH